MNATGARAADLTLWYLYDEPLPNRYAASIQILRTGAALADGSARFVHLAGQLAGSEAAILGHYGLTPRDGLALQALFPSRRIPELARQAVIGFALRRLAAELGQMPGHHVVMSRGETGVRTMPVLRRHIGRIPRVRLVHEMHCLDYLRSAEKRAGRSLDEAELAPLAQAHRVREGAALEAADALVYLTEPVRMAARASFGIDRPALVLPSGLEVLPAAAREKSYDIVYAGKLETRKGVHTLCEAMRHLPNRRLGIAGGTGAAFDAFGRRLTEQGLDDRVTLVGQLPPAEVDRFLQSGRVGVCPMAVGLASVSDRFTSPMKLMQMMGNGLPIVATDVPPIRAIVTDGREALLVPPDDPAALAAAVERLISDPELAGRLGAAARLAADRYSWTARAGSLSAFLHSLWAEPDAARIRSDAVGRGGVPGCAAIRSGPAVVQPALGSSQSRHTNAYSALRVGSWGSTSLSGGAGGRPSIAPDRGLSGRRAAFVVHHYPVLSETFVVNAALGLICNGWSVDIVPLGGTTVQPGVAHRAQDMLGQVAPVLAPRRPRFPRRLAEARSAFRTALGRTGPRALRLLDPLVFRRETLSLDQIFRAETFLEHGPYDIVHCHFGTLARPILALRRIGVIDAKVVVHFRGADITTAVAAQGAGLYTRVFGEADAFIANCEHFRQRAISLGCDPERIDVVPSGCDISGFAFRPRQRPATGPVRLLLVGRLIDKKGIDLAIEAVRRLRQEEHDLTLDILGDGPLRPALEAQVAAAGLTGVVAFRGAQPHEAVVRYMDEAHLFLAPSRTATNGDQDAAVNTLKEAMASGVPVVAARHGGIPELVQHRESGLLFAENDPGALAAAIAELIDRSAEWPAMGRTGRRKVVAEYSMEVADAKLLAVYARVLDAHTLPSSKEKRERTMTDTSNRVSIVISPRERFGAARESLANVLAETAQPFELIYVSGVSPAKLIEHIDAQASEHGFTHIKVDRMLSPNEARNIGAAAATGEFVVFLDNDVFCQPGWLKPLLDCADETRADVVAPLTCHGYPLHTTVHQAGGEFAPDPAAFFAQPFGQREIVEVMGHQNAKVGDLTLERQETQLCEFHAVLVRRSVFERLGPLDEGMMATKEHLDLCMSVIQSGGKVVFEPKSVVTYLFPNRQSPITMKDWPFFLVRWSPQWQMRSLKRFQEKWGLKGDGYLERRQGSLEWRHRAGMIRPLVRKVPGLRESSLFERAAGRVLTPFLRRATQMLVSREDRRRRDSAGGVRNSPPGRLA